MIPVTTCIFVGIATIIIYNTDAVIAPTGIWIMIVVDPTFHPCFGGVSRDELWPYLSPPTIFSESTRFGIKVNINEETASTQSLTTEYNFRNKNRTRNDSPTVVIPVP